MGGLLYVFCHILSGGWACGFSNRDVQKLLSNIKIFHWQNHGFFKPIDFLFYLSPIFNLFGPDLFDLWMVLCYRVYWLWISNILDWLIALVMCRALLSFISEMTSIDKILPTLVWLVQHYTRCSEPHPSAEAKNFYNLHVKKFLLLLLARVAFRNATLIFIFYHWENTIRPNWFSLIWSSNYIIAFAIINFMSKGLDMRGLVSSHHPCSFVACFIIALCEWMRFCAALCLRTETSCDENVEFTCCLYNSPGAHSVSDTNENFFVVEKISFSLPLFGSIKFQEIYLMHSFTLSKAVIPTYSLPLGCIVFLCLAL